MGTLIYLKAKRRPGAPAAAPLGGKHDLAGPLIVLWLGSVARVTLGFAHHEVFETEASLALLCTILLPLVAVRATRCRA